MIAQYDTYGDNEDDFLEADYEDCASMGFDPDEYHEAYASYYDDDCNHRWVAGMCYVHDEDVASVAETRSVTCEKCDHKATKGIDY
jgi:hypothetical protein